MLKKGDRIPALTLHGSDGAQHDLHSFMGTPLVIYFYPKNETAGCVAEACAFRDQYEDFAAVGAKVIGISADSVESHRRFKESRRLPFLLLSDKYHTAEKAFGVPRGLFGLIPGRVTFVVNAKGVVIHTFNSSTQFAKHVKESLAALTASKNEG